MSVSLMHQWHDSCVGEWFLTPSLWLWSACEWVRGEWMHPRSDLLSVYLSVIWWMWLCVQYTSFTTHWGHPSGYIWLHLIFWGLPSGFHMRRLLLLSDLFWARGDILNIRCYLNLDFELISSFYSWYITFTSIITLLNLYLYNVNIYTFWH